MLHPSTETTLLPFGKYKGYSFKYVAELDPSYLQWLRDTTTITDNIREAAKLTLAGESLEPLKLPVIQSNINLNAAMVLVNPTTVAVRFTYNKTLIERFKVAVDGRAWDDKNNCWTFPLVHLPSAINVFGGIKNVKCADSLKEA